MIVSDIRKDFPILKKKIHGNSLVYFDNGASAQKPEKVIEVIKSCYLNEYSNVHRGLHYLSNNLTDKFEAVREKIQVYLGARDPSEIIFTSGSTESLNLVAYSWGANNLREGDEIILSVMEHHSNIVPWHFLREKIGIKIIWADINTKGILEIDEVIKKISPKTKLISVTHMSNVLGSKVDIKSLCRYTRNKGIVVAVDGSQGCVHQKVDVSELDCDFYAITGHKLYGPSGSGALYVKQDKFDQMSPFMGGGEMIERVTKESVIYGNPPQKFEAGTPGIVSMIGFGAAIDYINSIGFDFIEEHEKILISRMNERLSELDWVDLHGPTSNKGSIFSFSLRNEIHPHDVSSILDQKGIAIRTGTHCAQPLMDFLGLKASCRASLAIYNTVEEIDKFIEGLISCKKIFNL